MSWNLGICRKVNGLCFWLLAGLIGWCLTAAQGQDPPSETLSDDRAILEVKVRARAERDVELGVNLRDFEELERLFGSEAERVGLSLGELLEIYENRYVDARAEIPKPPFLERLRKAAEPAMGWWVAGILFILLVFRDVLRDIIRSCAVAFKDHIYGKLAGSRVFRSAALRHYRRAVILKYEELVVPFRPDRPLGMREIFVPLKAQGAADTDLVDAQKAVAEHQRLMVTGAPGSGKSMLMRHLALTLVEPETYGTSRRALPVLLELNRLNDAGQSVEEHLVDVFRRNEFPHADEFVRKALEQGGLVLLFDGLDEVITERRADVVREIKDLLDTWEACRSVITCRTAVYRQEFSEVVDRNLEIVEFSDHQIWRFLDPWEADMPGDKSIDQLLQTLRDRPRIMALARNPLLLTIIAYLYTDTQFVLPHSRTEFYERSTELLLDQWGRHKNERPQFKSTQKRLVLQHLALFNQERGSYVGQDRRSIELKTVLKEVASVLPQLNLLDSDGQPLLDEIVERSGLLIAIDGGIRYQFAHLTLQEFFAAAELHTQGEQLLANYRADPAAWRETVKLWCGLGADSTDIIRAVFESHPITAFECLADAQKVQHELAAKITDHFRRRIAAEGDDGVAIRRAFATVAADLRPRGQEVFEFLVSLMAGFSDELKHAAIEALSFTNLPRAAAVLAQRYVEFEDARPALVRMGDLAVRPLVKLAEEGNLEAIDDLERVGTPQAALALVPLLWNFSTGSDETVEVAVRAAWRLGALLELEVVESELRLVELDGEQRRMKWYEWVWAPFEDSSSSALSVIAGRIVFLILGHLDLAPRVERFDVRLALAMGIHRLEQDFEWNWQTSEGSKKIDRFYALVSARRASTTDSESWYTDTKSRLNDLEDAGHSRKESVHYDTDSMVISRAFDSTIDLKGIWAILVPLHPQKLKSLILRRFQEPIPNLDDWRNLFAPIDFSFRRSGYFLSIMAAVFVITALSLRGLWSIDAHWAVSITALILLGWGILLFGILTNLDPDWLSISIVLFFPVGIILIMVKVLFESYRRKDKGLFGLALFSPLGFGILMPWWPLTCFLTYETLSKLLTIPGFVAFWAVFSATSTVLWSHGTRLQRRARNPLHGILGSTQYSQIAPARGPLWRAVLMPHLFPR